MRFAQLQLIVLSVLVACLAGPVAAQSLPPADQAQAVTPPGKPQKPPKLSPDEREIERIHQLLKCSDDEWTALQPLVARVYFLQNQLRNSRDRNFKMPKDGQAIKVKTKDKDREAQSNPSLAQGTQSPVIETAHNLRDAMASPDASTAELKQRILAARQARAKARTELIQAQEALRDVTSVHQEATLVLLGFLDY